MTAAAQLHHAEPEPTPGLLALYQATATLIAAQEDLRAHEGPKRGADWAVRTDAYRAAWGRFTATFAAIEGVAQ